MLVNAAQNRVRLRDHRRCPPHRLRRLLRGASPHQSPSPVISDSGMYQAVHICAFVYPVYALRDRIDATAPCGKRCHNTYSDRPRGEVGPTYFGESTSFINKDWTAAEVVHIVCDEAEQQLRRRTAELVK